MKKQLTAVLSLLGISLSLIGCGGTGGGGYDINNFLPNGTEENPYQIVKEPITLKVFAPHSAGNPEYKDLKMFKYLSKVTNINFEFTTPDTSVYTTIRSGVWQSGDIPDLFLFNNSISEIVQFQEKQFNVYVPFNDDSFSYKVDGVTVNAGNLINNIMPNYKKGLENNFGISKEKSDATKVASLNDGKMYETLSVRDVARDLTYKMFINQQWIDNLNEDYELGLPDADELETLDQYYEILSAFKKYDANRNGNPNDEIPVTSKCMEYLRNYILQAYGYCSYGPEINADMSHYDYVPLTEAYRNYLIFANKLWKENILHHETFVNKTDNSLAKFGQQNLLGSFVAAAPYLITGYELEDNYTTIPPIRDTKYYNGPKIQYNIGNFTPDGACIPMQSKYIREVARLVDIMYSDLGTQLISYGVENDDWTWDDAEKTSWTFHVPESWTGNQEQYRATITPNVNSGAALYWKNDFVGKMNDEILNKLNKQSEVYLPYLKIAEPHEIKLSSTEYDNVTLIKASLDPQLEFLEASLIRGDAGYDPNSDTDYTNFINKVKGYRAEELIKYYNDALARYIGGK